VVGLDTAHHVTEVMSAAYPDRMKFSDKPVTTAMFEHQRLGQKNGRGFYLHTVDDKGKTRKQDDPDVTAIIAECQKTSAEFSDEDIVARLMVPLCLEAVRALEDNIVGSAAEADMALVLGIGFPPFLGGALRYIDQTRVSELKGAAAFCAVADKFAALGKLYEPTAALRAMATAGKNFYPA
jgi:3-hydroxyacyl-CoA dehydrogenase/enoyl-CoA hydratase/3-hydroxybutyryl-CoA epimerase/enoyl-CoA isomerase